MNATVRIDGFVSESEAVERWPVLSLYRLKRARASNEIAWVKGPRGAAWYRPEAVESFIEQYLEQPCRDHENTRSSSLADNGSGAKANPLSFIDFGRNRDLEEHAAQASAQRILKPQNAHSRKS